MLNIEAIKYNYVDHLSFKFSLELDQGDSLAIIGPSGSGKSTLLNLIAGFISPSQGKIIFNDTAITNIPPSERPINMLFQEKNLFPHLTVFNNVAIGLAPNLKLDQNQHKIIMQALEKVGIESYANRLPNQLSGGQRQRIAIARVLVRKKPILLLDEPFLFLDPPLRIEMLDLIHNLQKELALITIMVTHDYNDCLRISNKVCFISAGRIVHIDETKNFAKTANSPIIKKFLGL